MYLQNLGIYGWSEGDENLLLASLLTGDPLLLIGERGAAKTHVCHKVAEALDKSSIVYDASKAMFEDVLGFPNTAKLQEGVVEYVPSPVTIWDKEFVVIDELNRALPELQSKWLEIFRSRSIMGFSTKVSWVWAAMNPVTYAGTQTLDDALIGRFAFFVYPPTALSMEEEDRLKVLTHINGDDAPSIGQWTENHCGAGTVSKDDVLSTGQSMERILHRAAQHFLTLRNQLTTLPLFISRFAALLARESNGKLVLDGRRLGFLHRNLLAVRAVEMAKAEETGHVLPLYPVTARRVVVSTIPAGLNEDSIDVETAAHAVEVCFDLLSAYFDDNGDLMVVDRIYELMTTADPLRKAALLLHPAIHDMAKSKAWSDLLKEPGDHTVLAYTALQVEAARPGSVPRELLESLSKAIKPDALTTRSVDALRGRDIEHIAELEALLQQPSDLHRLVAYSKLRQLVTHPPVTPAAIDEVRDAIEHDTAALMALLHPNPNQQGDAA